METLSVGIRLEGPLVPALRESVQVVNDNSPRGQRVSEKEILERALESEAVQLAVLDVLSGVTEDARETVAYAMEKEAAKIEREAEERVRNLREQAAEARNPPPPPEEDAEE